VGATVYGKTIYDGVFSFSLTKLAEIIEKAL